MQHPRNCHVMAVTNKKNIERIHGLDDYSLFLPKDYRFHFGKAPDSVTKKDGVKH